MKRQARDRRQRGVVVELTARDQALLLSLARFRIAGSRDLGRLFFPGCHKDVPRARLRRLFDAQFLEVHALAHTAENVYSLGPRGKDLVRERGMVIGAVPRPPWWHHLEIVDVWMRVALAAHAGKGFRLAHCTPDWEAREDQGPITPEAVPDLVIDLTVDDGESQLGLVVEVDRGTESMATLRRKIHVLSMMSSLHGCLPGKEHLALVVYLSAEGKGRMKAIRDLLTDEWAGTSRVWTDETDVEAELRCLMGTVTGSRYGNGRGGAGSPVDAMRSGATGGGLSDNGE